MLAQPRRGAQEFAVTFSNTAHDTPDETNPNTSDDKRNAQQRKEMEAGRIFRVSQTKRAAGIPRAKQITSPRNRAFLKK